MRDAREKENSGGKDRREHINEKWRKKKSKK